MKRPAEFTLLLLGVLAVAAVLSGQTAPADPADPPPPATPANTTRVAQSTPDAPTTDLTPRGPRGHSHPWQHEVDRPARTLGPKLTPEMIDLCMEVAHDIDENLAKQLEVLRQRDVRQFESKLRRSRRLTALAELKKRDPSSYDLKITELRVDATVSRLAAAARKARKAGQASEARALEQELEGQVILQLAFRYRARENYLCQLRELVERLERELKHEQENFDRVLVDRMKELLTDPDDPGQQDGRRDDAAPESDLAARRIVPE